MANNNVAIIGTGDFARAMALRLLRHGYRVRLYSRFPQRRTLTSQNKELSEAPVVDWNTPFDNIDYVIAAVPEKAYKSLGHLSAALAGHVVIEVSNPQHPVENKSNAELLQDFLPQSHVVKAFNTVSAYAIQSELSGESRTVLVCGNDLTARQHVAQFARELGFLAVEGGGLRQARQAEQSQRELFTEWQRPMIVLAVLMVLWIIYAILRYYVLRDPPYDWYRFPTNVMNKVFGCVTLTLLALVYLPGSIAAIIQLYRGTKYRPFSSFLDSWMKMRKQLGLFALFTGWTHILMSITMLNSSYFGSWFLTTSNTVKANTTADTSVSVDSRMNSNGELNVFFGLMGGLLMLIVGITSIPAVGALLNWREWKLVQSGIGLLSMACATTHVTLKGAYGWRGDPFSDIFPTMAFLSSFLPWVCFALIIVLWMPCFYFPLQRIRNGWERGISSADDEESTVKVGGSPKIEPIVSNGSSISIGQNGYDKSVYYNNGYATNNGYTTNEFDSKL